MQSAAGTTGEDAALGDDNFYTVAPEGATVRFIRRQNIALVVTVITADGLAQSKRLAELALSRF